MKRKITLIFVLLSLLLSLSVAASADATDPKLYISEDLQQVTMGEDLYIRADTSPLGGDYSVEYSVQPILTEAQKEQFNKVEVYCRKDDSRKITMAFIQVQFYQKDGMNLWAAYIREDLYQPYMDLLEQETYSVDFGFPDDNIATAEKSLLCGEETVLYLDELRRSNFFPVSAIGQQEMTLDKGWLVIVDKAYYYVDLEENDMDEEEYLTSLPKVKAWRVTAREQCTVFDKAMDRYYGEGLGMLEDPEVTDRVSNIFLLIMFCFLPLATLITFAVFAIVTKKTVYRVLYIIVCGCAILVLTAVLLVALIV